MFQATGTISGGVLQPGLTVTIPGNYTLSPTSYGAEPVTGGGLVGATVTLTTTALSVVQLVADVSASPPANPVATTATNVRTGGGSGLTLNLTWTAANTLALLPSGGTVSFPPNSIAYAALPSGVQQVPVAFAFSGNPALNARVNVPVTMAMTEPGLTGTYVKVYASTAPTGAPVFTLYRVIGGAGAPVSIGTITWTAASQNSATFAGAGASLAASDVLQLVCTTADAAIADVGITIQCARV
jgi:hypothetical protein